MGTVGLIDASSRNAEAVAWAKSFIALVAALESYVKQWHTTGVVWNPKVRPAYPERFANRHRAPQPPHLCPRRHLPLLPPPLLPLLLAQHRHLLLPLLQELPLFWLI